MNEDDDELVCFYVESTMLHIEHSWIHLCRQKVRLPSETLKNQTTDLILCPLQRQQQQPTATTAVYSSSNNNTGPDEWVGKLLTPGLSPSVEFTAVRSSGHRVKSIVFVTRRLVLLFISRIKKKKKYLFFSHWYGKLQYKEHKQTVDLLYMHINDSLY